MGFRSTLAKTAARTTYWFLRHVLKRGGTSLPGKIAVAIDPNILAQLQDDFDLVVVTGTNGKTLTTALITRVLRHGGRQVITNPSGSNMIQGITGTLLTQPKQRRSADSPRPIAVLEIDEANVARVTESLTPKMFVLTNIFRDQLDRYGEVYTTYNKILAGIAKAPAATVLTNADSPIFMRGDLPNPKRYFGFDHVAPANYRDQTAPNNTDGILSPTDNQVLHYHFMTYGNLGYYYSPSDGFQRPALDYAVTAVDDLTPTQSTFTIDGQRLTLGIGGLYNIYNALTAFAVGREFGLTPATIQAAFARQEAQIFGRQEQITVGDKDVKIVLIKNPVGANSVIDMMATETEPFSLVGLLNANYADGIDTSWIWDAEFEKLHDSQLQVVATGGERYRDLHVRFKMAHFKEAAICEDLTTIVTTIAELPTEKVYIAATYTAMLQVREQFMRGGYIKGGFA